MFTKENQTVYRHVMFTKQNKPVGLQHKTESLQLRYVYRHGKLTDTASLPAQQVDS